MGCVPAAAADRKATLPGYKLSGRLGVTDVNTGGWLMRSTTALERATPAMLVATAWYVPASLCDAEAMMSVLLWLGSASPFRCNTITIEIDEAE